MIRAITAIGAALSLLAAGCAASMEAATPGDRKAEAAELSPQEVEGLIGEVAALRGVALPAPIPVERLDAEHFAEAVDTYFVGDNRSNGERIDDTLSAAAQGMRKKAERAMMQEQIIGFYDEGSRKVFLRPSGGSTSGLDVQRMLIAHEIEHALQHLRFGSSRLNSILDEDTRLARLAIFEGEASMVGVAYLAVREGVPIKRAILRVTQASRFRSGEQMLRMHARSPELAGASPTDRERLLFPYVGGMDFMIAIYRAGGFPLVDRVFARPPTTTEQVLHPEKYVTGEAAIPVRAPIAPPGYEPINTGRMGELQTRALLSQCMDPRSAAIAAEGWGGDAFTIVQKDGARAVLWSTAWDSEMAAARFEQALRYSGTCWPEMGGGRAYVARDRTKVAFLRGLPDAILPSMATALLALPEDPPPPSPPLGDVRLPPLFGPPPEIRGTLWQGFYQSARLNLVAPLPPGFTASTMEPDAELVIRLPGFGSTGILAVSDRIISPKFNEQIMRSIADEFSAKFPGRFDLAWSGNVNLPIGPALARIYHVEDTSIGVRLLLVPVCNGAGGYLFAEVWGDEAQRDILDRWVMSFRPFGPSAPPVCQELDPQ